MSVRLLWIIPWLCLTTPAWGATTSPFTYHGRILLPNGSPETDSNVQFKIQVRSPGTENCLLYEETQTLNMSGSAGAFSLTLNSSSSTRTDGGSYSIEQIMANSGTFTVTTCITGTTYTPGVYDSRSFVVSFSDSTMGGSFDAFPAQAINYVPKAIDAEQVGGFPASSLLRVANSGTPGAAAALTSAQFTNLQALINGSSTQYVPTGSAGATIPSYSTAPTGAVAGDIWYNSTSGELQYYNGSASQTIGTSGAGISSLTVTNNLTAGGTAGGTLTGPGTIDLNTTGVTAGTYSSVTVDTFGRVTGASNTIGGTTAINTSGTITTTGNISGQNISANGGSFRTIVVNDAEGTPKTVTIQAPAAFTSSYSLTLPTALPTTGGSMLVSSTAGVLSWVVPVSSSGSTMTGELVGDSGSAAAPSFGFTGDTGTGFYDNGANGIAVTNNGAQSMALTSSGIAGMGAMSITAGGTNQNLTLDSSGTGSVNIGTGNGTGLSVLDPGAASADYVTVEGSAVGGTPSIGTGGADTNINLKISPKGTGNTIFANGNVGIGTSTPAAPLSVGSTSQFQVDGLGNVTAAGANPGNSGITSGNGMGTVGGVNTVYASSGGGIPWPYQGTGRSSTLSATNSQPTDSSGSFLLQGTYNTHGNAQYSYIGSVSNTGNATYTPTIVFGQQTGATAYAERMRIDQNGNVGVGTTSPATTLDVNGAISERGMAAPAVSPAGQGRMYFDSTSNQFMVSQNGGAYAALGVGSAGLNTTGGTMTGELVGDTGSAATPSFGFTGNTTTGFYDAGSNTIGVTNSGTESMVLSSGGITGTGAMAVAAGGTNQNLTLSGSGTGNVLLTPKVGIGTTSAANALEVYTTPTSGLTNVGLLVEDATMGNNTGSYIGPNAADNAFYMVNQVGNLPNYNTYIGMNGGNTSGGYGNLNFVAGTWQSPVSANTRMTILGLNGDVGIGTTTPGGLLDVEGGTAASGAGQQIILASQSGAGNSPGGNILLLPGAHGPSTDVDGKVGIGTTNPGSNLDVFSSNPIVQATITARTSATSTGAIVSTTNDAGNVTGIETLSSAAGGTYSGLSNDGLGMVYSNSPIGLVVSTTVATPIVFSTNQTARMEITSSGSVGIGTTTPATALDLNGAESVRGIAAPALSPAGQGRIYFDSTSNQFMVSQNGGAYAALGVGSSGLNTTGGTMTGEIVGDNGAAATPSFGFTGDTQTGFYDNGSHGVSVANSGVASMTFSSGGTITGASGLNLDSTGTNSVNVGTGNGTALSVLDDGAATADYVTVKGSAAGGSPSIATAGTDTNINLTIAPKGTGNTVIGNGNVGIGTTTPAYSLTVGSVSSGTYFGVDSSTGNVTMGGSLTINNSYLNSANVDTNVYSSTSATASVPDYEGYFWNNSATNGGYATIGLAAKNSSSKIQGAYIGAVSNSGAGAYTPTIVIGQQTGAAAYAERMRIDQNGNVGIGTTAPVSPLTMYTTSTTATTIGAKENRVFLYNNSITVDSGAEIVVGAADTTTGRYAAIGTNIESNTATQATGDIYLATKTNPTDTALTPRLYVMANGNVGIGNVGPSASLDVKGSGTTSATDGFAVRNNASAYSFIVRDDGNVGIGTTTPAGNLAIDNTAHNATLCLNGVCSTTLGGGGGLSASGGTMTGELVGDNGTAATPSFGFTGDTGTGFFDNGSHGITVTNNGVSSMNLTSTGITGTGAMTVAAGGTNQNLTLSGSGTGNIILNPNVGIGTTSPAAKLDVNGSIDIAGANGISEPIVNSNLAIGPTALNAAAAGMTNNIAIGSGSLSAQAAATDNIAIGVDAMQHWTGGFGENIAIGSSAIGFAGATGANNIAIGYGTLQDAQGSDNVAVGGSALLGTTGGQNVGVGYGSGQGSFPGSASYTDSALVGYNAGNALTTGSKNILIGSGAGSALTTGGSNILIGYDATTSAVGASNTLNIGNVIFATGMTGTYASPAGSVGIGTTTPSAPLNLVSNNASDAIVVQAKNASGWADMNFYDNSGNDVMELGHYNGGGIFSQYIWSSAGLNFIVNGSTTAASMSIASNGSVGIGTSTPAAPLSVGSTSQFQVDGLGNVTAAGANPGNSGITSGNGMGTVGGVNTVYASSGGGIPWPYQGTGRSSTLSATNSQPTDSSGSFLLQGTYNTHGNAQYSYIGSVSNTGNATYTPTIVFGQQTGATAYAERMRIDQNGNVGIGTTSPASALDVTGAIDLGGLNGISFPSSDTTAGGSIAIGPGALMNQPASAAYYNIAIGNQSMGGGALTTAAIKNTAIGFATLQSDTSGNNNVAMGHTALQLNTTGSNNVAVGGDTAIHGALRYNTSGNQNTGVGGDVLNSNTTGNNNSAFGYLAGFSVFGGNNNTVIGYEVASTNLGSGSSNILIGTSNAVDTPLGTTSNFLNIGNAIFATGMTGTLASPAGNVGIGTTTPAGNLAIDNAAHNATLCLNGTCTSALVGGGGSYSATGAMTFNSDSANGGTGGFNFQSDGSNIFAVDNSGDGTFKGTLSFTAASQELMANMVNPAILEAQPTTANTNGSFAVVPSGSASQSSLFVGGNGSFGGSTSYGYMTQNGVNLTLGDGSPTGSLTLATNSTAAMTILPSGNVGIGTTNPAEKLEVASNLKVDGQTYGGAYIVASGGAVDFNNGNIQVLQSVGGSTITLTDLKQGGAYMLILTDTTARTYTFSGCTTTQFNPANGLTTSGTTTIFNIVSVMIGGVQNCFVSWASGYQ